MVILFIMEKYLFKPQSFKCEKIRKGTNEIRKEANDVSCSRYSKFNDEMKRFMTILFFFA